MANKKTTDNITLQTKVKVIKKLHQLGCKTEKELLSLTMLDVLRIENISIQDIAIILELQRQVKKHTLYSYLSGDVENTEIISSGMSTKNEIVASDEKA